MNIESSQTDNVINVQEEIFRSVETIVKKIINEQKLTTVIFGMVKEVLEPDSVRTNKRLGNEKRYVVKADGTEYTVTDGVGINPTVGKNVWVLIPSGDFSRAFICGKG